MNLIETERSVGYCQGFRRHMAEVFLEGVPGRQETIWAAVTDRMRDAERKSGLLWMVGSASVRSSECWLSLESNVAHVSGIVEWLLDVTASVLPRITQLRLGSILLELLYNAVEHGNLEIGYQEKRQALAENRYEDLLRQRLGDPALNTRRVTIHVCSQKDTEQLIYHIADEGNGFAWRPLLQCSDESCGPAALNGRGIFIARSLSTHLIYNERGNEVTMRMAASPA